MTADSRTAAKRSSGLFLVALVGVGLVAAVAGAWLDWMWWPVYSGVTITLFAIGLLVVGAILAVVPRRPARRAGLLVLAAAVGALLGQNLGPSREPLIQSTGTITLALDAPVVETATAEANCSTVASGTEFSISGDPNMRLSDRSFVSIYLNSGDRWVVWRDGPRSNGVLLEISVTPEAVPAHGGPATVGMQATRSSTVDADLANEGGRVRFADLEPMTGVDYTGAALDLAGAIEWSCNPA